MVVPLLAWLCDHAVWINSQLGAPLKGIPPRPPHCAQGRVLLNEFYTATGAAKAGAATVHIKDLLDKDRGDPRPLLSLWPFLTGRCNMKESSHAVNARDDSLVTVQSFPDGCAWPIIGQYV